MAEGDVLGTDEEATEATRSMSPGSIRGHTEVDFVRGAVLGRYMVIEPIGSGGMGLVYRAYDPELDRHVAIKLLRSALWDSEGRLRLLREAQAMARLSHPNVVTVHDVGTFGSQVFLAMECVDGVTLKEWSREAPRSWREVVGVFVQAGRGLAAAHAAGIVHRDVKSSNILIGRSGRVKVMDFGVARHAGAPSVDGDENSAPVDPTPNTPDNREVSSSAFGAPLTQAGDIVGTPAYMAPEQARGVSDIRTDQYGFCVSLYETLFGERPRRSRKEAAEATGSAAKATSVPARSTRVPAWVRRVVDRGLRRDPKERYSSMEELLADLTNDPAIRRRRVLAVFAVILVLAASVFVALSRSRGRHQPCTGSDRELAGVWDGEQKRVIEAAFLSVDTPAAASAWKGVERSLDRYAADWSAAHRETCEATAIRGEQSAELLDVRMLCLSERREELRALATLFAHPDGALVAKAVDAAHRLSRVSDCADTITLAGRVRPPQDPAGRARLEEMGARLAEARTLFNAGQTPDALPIAAKLGEDVTTLGYRPLEARVQLLRAQVAADLGDAKLAAGLARSAARAAIAGRDPVLEVRSWNFLALVLGDRLARLDDAEQALDLAAARLEAMGGHEELQMLLLTRRGMVAALRGDHRAAEQHYLTSLDIAERVFGPTDLEAANIHSWLNLTYVGLGDLERALAHSQRDVEICEENYGAQHPALALAFNNLGLSLTPLGRTEEARAAFERSMAIYEAVFGADYFLLAMPLCNLGDLFVRSGKLELAKQHYSRSLALCKSAFGLEHPDLVHPMAGLATVLAEQGDFDGARAQYDQAISIWEKAHGPDHPFLALLLSDVGGVELRHDRPAEAMRLLERAYAIADLEVMTVGDRGLLRLLLARALWDSSGDRDRARELVVLALEDLETAGERFASDLADAKSWLAAHGR